MWRSKKGFEEFLRILKEMPSLNRGYEKGVYDYVKRGMEYKTINVKTLLDYVETIKYQNTGCPIEDEELRVRYLKSWFQTNMWYHVPQDEFKNTRKKLEYYDRWVKFNDS
tara:strand:+ start:627 stop:956 length:330 start_codon:yes stop_codon:yes gene_type:complete